MPYGVSAAQLVLDAGTTSPRSGDRSKSSSSSFKVPGFGGGSSSNGGNGKGTHFGGDARATSTNFSGVMQALLKPRSSGPAAAAAAKPQSPERPQATFRPRSALDLSGHSFSKTMKAEISRSKIAKANAAQQGGGGGITSGPPKHGWWDTSGGLGMDDSLSRSSSTGSVASSRSSHLHAAPRGPTVVGSGGSALQHQQRQRLQQQQQQKQQQTQQQTQQQSMSMCRPRTYGESCLDELSRAVGLQ